MTQPKHTPYAAWAVLSVMGGSSVIFNVVHAFRHAPHNWLLPALYGIGPVLAAVLLSHIGADRRVGKWTRAAVVVVMLLSMATSIGATADIVEPMSGPYLNWLYGAIMDAAALVALRVILDSRSKAAGEATALEAAEAEARAARSQAAEADNRAAAAETALASTRAELEAVRAKLPARNTRRGSARKPARNTAAASARNQPAGSAPALPPEADLDTEAQALLILGEEPGISGSQLGIRLGKSDRYGRELIKRLAPSVAGPDTAQ